MHGRKRSPSRAGILRPGSGNICAHERAYGRSKEELYSDFWEADGADDADFLIIRCLRLIYIIGISGLGSLYCLLSGAWGLFIFFCLDAKENRIKRKNQGCISAATTADFYAKREKLASLRQFPALHAPKCACALRRRADADSLGVFFTACICG